MTAPRRVEIGDAVLWLGDARDCLGEIGAVDAVVTDPPYGIGFGEYSSHKDDPAAYPALISSVLSSCEALLTDGWMVMFMGAPRAHEWQALVPRQWRILACAKNFTQILPCKGPLWSTDFALFWPVGKPPQQGKNRDFHLAITSDMRDRPKGHPCPRPLDQMRYVVDCFSEVGDRVADPFMGSGTTGVASVLACRSFVGCEIDPAYHAIAVRRITEAQRQRDLFHHHAPPAPRAVQPDLLAEALP